MTEEQRPPPQGGQSGGGQKPRQQDQIKPSAFSPLGATAGRSAWRYLRNDRLRSPFPNQGWAKRPAIWIVGGVRCPLLHLQTCIRYV